MLLQIDKKKKNGANMTQAKSILKHMHTCVYIYN